MKRNVQFQRPQPWTQRQIFLLENDSGVLCRLIGLYAARGLRIDRLEFSYAAPQTMVLTIEAAGDVDLLRVLVEKGASMVGVIEGASC